MFPDVSRIRRLSAEQEQVIRSGRLALLQMRRVADAHRMHLTKPPGASAIPLGPVSENFPHGQWRKCNRNVLICCEICESLFQKS